MLLVLPDVLCDGVGVYSGGQLAWDHVDTARFVLATVHYQSAERLYADNVSELKTQRSQHLQWQHVAATTFA